MRNWITLFIIAGIFYLKQNMMIGIHRNTNIVYPCVAFFVVNVQVHICAFLYVVSYTKKLQYLCIQHLCHTPHTRVSHRCLLGFSSHASLSGYFWYGLQNWLIMVSTLLYEARYVRDNTVADNAHHQTSIGVSYNLAHFPQVRPKGVIENANIGSDNGLMFCSINILAKITLTSHQ